MAEVQERKPWSRGRPLDRGLGAVGGTSLTAQAERWESTIFAGFRVEWLSAEFERDGRQVRADMTCGAGVGSPWLHLAVEVDGEHRYEVVDARELMSQWMEAVLEAGPTRPYWTALRPGDRVELRPLGGPDDRWEFLTATVVECSDEGLVVDVDASCGDQALPGASVPGASTLARALGVAELERHETVRRLP